MGDSFDLAVIGGGPAGIATALAACDAGLAVLVLERSDFTGVRVGEHLGAEALPLLSALGLGPATWQDGHLPCASVVSIWGDGEPQEAHALFHPLGEGVILARPEFDRRLACEAEARGVVVHQAARLSAFERGPGGWRLVVTRGGRSEDLGAAFLVDATGRTAQVARLLGSRRIAYDRLTGITAFVRPARPAGDRSLHIEATERGWWYAAPLWDGRWVLTFMTDADLIGDSPSACWGEQLARSEHVRALAAGCEAMPEVHVRSARSQRLAGAAGPAWLAVGDAAMSFDPLSSAGIRKGLQGGLQAAATARAWLAGHAGTLERYDEEVESSFGKYLRRRADYYRAERRWPASRFWSRRHRPLPHEAPIAVDPQAVVGAGATRDGARALLTEEMPQLDVERLVALCAEPRPAHEIVSAYSERIGGRALHRDLIHALGVLVEAGALTARS